MPARFTAVRMFVALLSVSASWQGTWKEFRSTTGFAVMYPSTWRRIGKSQDRLDILSSQGGAQGVVIRRGQAEIIVMEVLAPATVTVSEVIELDNRGDSVLSRRELHSGPATGRDGCRVITEVLSRDEVGPGAYNIDTGYYCEIRGRKFRTLLRTLEGDRRQEQYRLIALRVAQSLRLVQ